MSSITHNIPPIEWFVNKQFLTQDGADWCTNLPCVAHSITTIPGQALLFNILLEDGSMFNRLPIWAFGATEDFDNRDLLRDYCQMWDVPSTEAAVVRLDLVAGSRVEHKKNKDCCPVNGEYLFSVDFAGSPEAEGAGSFGHKIMHVCKLDNGLYVAAPNSRLAFLSKAYVKKPWTQGEPPPWRSQVRVWRAE